MSGSRQDVRLVKFFYHNDDGCPKRVKPVVQDKSLVEEEGFVEIIRKEKVSFRVLISNIYVSSYSENKESQISIKKIN